MHTPISGLGKAFVPFLPTVSSSPIVVYSSRRLIVGYAGNLFRLNRISDGVTLDIGSLADGSPDISGVAAFLGAATFCRVDKIYDQLASGNDATNAVTASMPNFSLNNAVLGKYSLTFNGDGGTYFLNIPSAITGSGQATSIVHIADYMSTNVATIAEVGATISTAGSLGVLLGSVSSNAMNIWTSTHFGNPANNARSRSQTQVTVATSGTTQITAYVDQIVAAALSSVTGTWVGGFIGKAPGVSTAYNGEWFGMVIYPSELSSTDAQTLIYSLSPIFNCLQTSNTQLVLSGNSIVQGTKATLCFNNLRQAEPLFNRRIFTRNEGVFGQLASTVHGAIASYTAQYNPAFSKNLIYIIEPTNDIQGAVSGNISAPSTAGGGGSGSVGTNVWNNYTLPDILSLEAAGFTVLIPTVLNRSWAGSGTDITQYTAAQLDWNTLARASGRTVADYQAIPNMSNPANTTYFADGTHPTSTGYGLMAAVNAAAVNANI